MPLRRSEVAAPLGLPPEAPLKQVLHRVPPRGVAMPKKQSQVAGPSGPPPQALYDACVGDSHHLNNYQSASVATEDTTIYVRSVGLLRSAIRLIQGRSREGVIAEKFSAKISANFSQNFGTLSGRNKT